MRRILWGQEYLRTRGKGDRVDVEAVHRACAETGADTFCMVIFENYKNSREECAAVAEELRKRKIETWIDLARPNETELDEGFLLRIKDSAIKAVCLDDWNGGNWTNDSTKALVDVIGCCMLVLPVVYPHTIGRIWETSISGVVFPYLWPHGDHRTISSLLPELEAAKDSLMELGSGQVLVGMGYDQQTTVAFKRKESRSTNKHLEACLRGIKQACDYGTASDVAVWQPNVRDEKRTTAIRKGWE